MRPSLLLGLPVRRAALASLVFALLVLTGCRTEPDDALGTAFVAPASVNLRAQVAQKNSTVAILKHGQRVSILDVRRRFVKIRTQSGAEGWVDSFDLLTPEQMQAIQQEREQALRLPSQGTATAYETLNIHLEPSRQSPAFAQIPEGGPVSVLTYRAVARTNGPAKPPVFSFERPAEPARKGHKEKQARNASRLPPKPPAPKPPANWQALSYGFDSGAKRSAQPANGAVQEGVSKATPAAPQKRPVIEEWALVRTKSNQVGWVVARNLMMGIPDEVAQYAEGHRITSYFDLGAVNDEEKGLKHNWLWTTLGSEDPFDFDAWRVFLWNRRRHRYETSYRKRDVEGYFPVHVDPPDTNEAGRTFSLITKDDDGRMRRRTYLFDGVRVHLTATEDYRPPAATNAASAGMDAQAAKTPHTGWLARNWAALKRRLLGGA